MKKDISSGMELLLKKDINMNNIKELMDEEKGNDLIIIGGGPSVREWRKSYKQKRNQKIMVVNYFHELDITPDYCIYQDGIYKEHIENKMIYIPNTTVLISLKEQACERTNYIFIQNDMILPGSHTGFVALQITDKILNPDKIYLIGFDYYFTIIKYQVGHSQKIHYYDKYFNEFGDLEKYRYYSAFKGMLNDFKKCTWNKDRIINLNPESLLKL